MPTVYIEIKGSGFKVSNIKVPSSVYINKVFFVDTQGCFGLKKVQNKKNNYIIFYSRATPGLKASNWYLIIAAYISIQGRLLKWLYSTVLDNNLYILRILYWNTCQPLNYITIPVNEYKVVISVCLCVCQIKNSGTPWPICLKFWLGNSGEPHECS